MFSCKVKDDKIIGHYKMKHFPKTTLHINSDHTFTFTKINPNPYLHPFDHLEEFYFVTSGTWKKGDKNQVILNSYVDSLHLPLMEIKELPNNTDRSNFNFVDKYNDPVQILYVENLGNGLITAPLHSSMDNFSEKLQENDSLKFSFYGYKSLILTHSKKGNLDYRITLLPPFVPKYFDELKLNVKNRKLVNRRGNVKFSKN